LDDAFVATEGDAKEIDYGEYNFRVQSEQELKTALGYLPAPCASNRKMDEAKLSA
jgi:hypothetical protein